MVQNLLTEDNLPSYHREIAMNFSMDGAWGYWVNRWTAEENLHAIAIRQYLVVTRNTDPNADERVRVNHVMRGYRAAHYSQIETLVFMALWERAHAVYLRNLEAKITEPTLKKLVGRIRRDEERHQEFFSNLVLHCLENRRDQTICAIAQRGNAFPVIGGDILEYRDNKIRTVAEAGIFDQNAADLVVSDSVRDWGLAGEAVLEKFLRA
jgi:acyl-[acyl-carrier-protein] desaturase